MRQHHLHLPSNLALLLKTVIMIEGLGVNLDPDFQLTKSLRLTPSDWCSVSILRSDGFAALDVRVWSLRNWEWSFRSNSEELSARLKMEIFKLECVRKALIQSLIALRESRTGLCWE